MGKAKVPSLLVDYLDCTEQDWQDYSDGSMLNEAEWVLYKCYDGESRYCEAHPSSKAALRRYVDRLRAAGVKPDTSHLK